MPEAARAPNLAGSFCDQLMLTAWSAGAIVGPLLIAAVPYRMALPIIACMLAVAAVLPLIFTALVQRSVPATPGRSRLRVARVAVHRVR